ncbi:hypothetical protein AAT19DRAFT_11536 [Rhodotorula toruloides]|uniref:FAD-dependent oxidoreductase 2 FAD-binding domain-containing protein n=1 Tax=Rhodotorula toruloides TaxID=5286 RepID=A0A2S9ZX24_RHOTO|nr:hypothetical protein AAT19DRAFT_11536 [Rhodotorula toruloides]
MTITYALMEKLEDLAESDPTRVKILKKANVRKLVKDGDKVVGCEYEYQGKQHTAHGPVILATGRSSRQVPPELLKLSTTNGDHCQGDGQKMAMAIGANGIDLEKVQVHPTVSLTPGEPDAKVKFLAAEALRGVGGLLINKEGDRFADELGHRRLCHRPHLGGQQAPCSPCPQRPGCKEIEWHCKCHYVGRGLMKKFDTVADIAKEMGIEASKLQKTFNDGCVVFAASRGLCRSYLLKSLSSGSGAVARLGRSTTTSLRPRRRSRSTRRLSRSTSPSTGPAKVRRRVRPETSSRKASRRPAAANEVSTAVKQDEETKAGGGEKPPSRRSTRSTRSPSTTPRTTLDRRQRPGPQRHELPQRPPGGAKALLLYAGKEASEEFNLLHDPKVVSRYAPDTVIGTYKQ